MQGKTWEQNRKLLLSLGTNKYRRPAQLPKCEVVFETPRNRLTNAENHVEPFGDLTFVYSARALYLSGLPLPKKGFLRIKKWNDQPCGYRNCNFLHP